MTKELCRNEANLAGEITTPIVRDHSNMGVDFFKFYIAIERLSGVKDEIPVIVSGDSINKMGIKLEKGDFVRVAGEYRSYSDGETGKLLLYVYAKRIIKYDESEEKDGLYNNSIILNGFVCKSSGLRITPMGKRIVDVIIAVNRFNKSSYIPCILWNLSDEEANNIEVGDKMSLIGRIQSREYQKRLDEETVETRIAYEVSVSEFSIEK